MSDRPTRDISADFLKKLTTEEEYSRILKIARENKCLILPRGYTRQRGYRVIIYYQGQKVLEIAEKEKSVELTNKFVKKCRNEWDLENFFKASKTIIELYPDKSDEKTTQQEMFFTINENNNDYFVFDMEYQQHKNDKDKKKMQKEGKKITNDNPRADLVAVKNDGTLVFIELKVKNGAVSGNHGIAKHLETAERFPDASEFRKMISQTIELNKIETTKNLELKGQREYIFSLIDCNGKSVENEFIKGKDSIKSLVDKGWKIYSSIEKNLTNANKLFPQSNK